MRRAAEQRLQVPRFVSIIQAVRLRIRYDESITYMRGRPYLTSFGFAVP